MATIKKTWKELMTNQPSTLTAFFTATETLASQVDSAFNTKYGFSTNVSGALSAIKTDFLNSTNSVWDEMPIYMSSFKWNDRRFILDLQDRLQKYLGFIKKMITDEGLKRRMIINRSYSNGTHSTGTDKNYFSETPQAELDNFENALIRYASNLGKNTNDTQTNQNGSSGETTTSTNWDEEFKNLEFAFYNDLVDFITRLPDMIYQNYCLDQRPFTEVRRDWWKHLKDLRDIYLQDVNL